MRLLWINKTNINSGQPFEPMRERREEEKEKKTMYKSNLTMMTMVI